MRILAVFLLCAGCSVELTAPSQQATIECERACPGDLLCNLDNQTCVARGDGCVVVEGGEAHSATDGNDCTLDDDARGICLEGACVLSTCGDGVTDPPEEACDDGNDDDSDGCTSRCRLPDCGDGFLQEGEICDDGNDVATDECTNACRDATCGDNVVQDGVEECDDGNDVDTDGCTNACTLPECGSGTCPTRSSAASLSAPTNWCGQHRMSTSSWMATAEICGNGTEVRVIIKDGN